MAAQARPARSPETLVRRQLLDDLAEGMLTFIRDQGLVEGDRLPSAGNLARRFGVAVPTLREALRRLEATGALRIRHGSGVYVSDLSRLILANPHRNALEAETIIQLLEARELVEPHLAELAAHKRTSAQLKELEEILSQSESSLADDANLTTSNMAFHQAIAHCAGNVVLAQTIDTIVELYAPEQEVILRLYGDRKADHAEHKQILTAIRDKDAARAARRMRAHLAGVRRVVVESVRTAR